MSAANAAGFNNALAVCAAAASGIAAMLLAQTGRRGEPAQAGGPALPIRVFWAAAVVYALVLGSLAALVRGDPLPYGEAAQFLDRADFVRRFGLEPYRDFQFAYGPLLLYLPAGLSRLTGWSSEAGYFASLLAMSAAGLYFAFWTTNRLAPSLGLRVAAFGSLFVFGLNPTLGMNYTYFRFATPVAALVLLEQSRTGKRAAVVAAGASVLLYSISPEIGVGFSIAAIVLSVLQSRMAAGLLSLAGMPLFLWLFGGGYLSGINAYRGGCFNFAIVPAPHTVALLAALILIAPPGGGALPLDFALYAMALAYLPGALGRSDGGHVLWYELPLFWLCFAAFARYRPPVKRISAALACALVLWISFCVARIYATPLLQLARLSGGTSQAPDSAGLDAILAKQPVSTPLRVDRFMERMLKQTGRYLPEFHPDFDLVADARDEAAKIGDLRRAEWALIPKRFEPYGENIGFTRAILRFPVWYREAKPPYLVGEALMRELQTNWSRKGEWGDYFIYRRRAAR